MSEVMLKIENLSKQYRLGVVSSTTLGDDLKRWWYQIRGKDNPFLKIGEVNNRVTKGASDYVWALKDINFEVKRGEVLGIIGKNGAGKSTLLKILSKVTGPTTGSIKSRGRIASLLEVGTGFHPELTGKENVYLNGAILGMTKNEINSKYDEIVEFSGCERYIDTPVKRYSSGMRVRLAFAVAAFLEPDILVIDEVLAVGDAEFQKKAIGKMQDISKGNGRTVLFVSHNMAAVKSLCTRGIVLNDGTVGFEGNQDECVNFYLKTNEGKKLNQELRFRKDRTGNGKIKFSKVEILNKLNENVDSVISGEFLRLKVFFDIEDKLINDLIFGFTITDQNEELKSIIVTDEMKIAITPLVLKNKYLIIDFDKILLRGGQYNFKFVLSEGDTERINQLDNIEKALQLNVLPGDLYKIGKTNRSNNSVLMHCKFK